jgi:NAD(P)-dependent dehydrogenase (short-subunit alcohol dehydrogenase family)
MKTVLITGANRGIGLEFARQYAMDGWRVLACCRHPESAEALNKLAGRYPARLTLHALDVAEHTQIARLGLALAHECIDLLINNAGVLPGSGKEDFGHTDYEAWMHALRVNTIAPLKMVETFAPQIARSGLKTIVTITSKMGSIADNSSGGYYIYRSSKAAVNIVVKSLAIDMKPRGVKAIVLHPGWVSTDMGGPGAMITPEQSVSGMRKVIASLTPDDSGKFFAYDGQPIPW